jgi:hypothetical protein
MKLFNSEPAAFLAVVQAALALGIGFGAPISTEQMGLLMAFSAALLGLWTRAKVTPA